MSLHVLPDCPECGGQLREDTFNGMAMCFLSYTKCSRDGVYLTQDEVRRIRDDENERITR